MQYSRFHGRPCPYCGDPMVGNGSRRPTRDHVIPKRLPGTGFQNNPANKLIVCSQCNSDKGHQTLAEWAERLRVNRDARYLLILAVIRSRPAIMLDVDHSRDGGPRALSAPTQESTM